MGISISHDDRAKYLKCVLYECDVLARCAYELRRTDDPGMAEVLKTAGALKLRSVYDFLHRPSASDTIKRRMFDVYSPTVPAALNNAWDTWLTHQSINTYFVHLDRQRLDKSIPQPKFARGETAVIDTAILLLDQARVFADSIIQHRDFPGLDTYGKRYWTSFKATLSMLQTKSATS